MSVDAESAARPVTTAAAGDVTWLRRGSLAVLALVVVEYGIGMYVNLYVTVLPAGSGSRLGSAIAHGPVMLGVHAALGLLIGICAFGVLFQAVLARHVGTMVASAAGLLALASAATSGANFISNGRASESMAMALLAGVGLLCYAANLYLAGRPSQGG
jgi:hypothetical protein